MANTIWEKHYTVSNCHIVTIWVQLAPVGSTWEEPRLRDTRTGHTAAGNPGRGSGRIDDGQRSEDNIDSRRNVFK
jgi:hypothetical protein